MKRTWPCERMKNSRSGNQFRRLSRREPAVLFLKWTPFVPTQSWRDSYRPNRPAANPRVNDSGESNLNHDEPFARGLAGREPAALGANRARSHSRRPPADRTVRAAAGRRDRDPSPLADAESPG